MKYASMREVRKVNREKAKRVWLEGWVGGW